MPPVVVAIMISAMTIVSGITPVGPAMAGKNHALLKSRLYGRNDIGLDNRKRNGWKSKLWQCDGEGQQEAAADFQGFSQHFAPIS